MLIINNGRKNDRKYNGAIVVTEKMLELIDHTFNSKFEAFKFAIEQGWSRKSIMKHVLQTERDQYFYNYYTKYLASK
jgi:hypothetical protein